jgi:hypothetical protein
MNPDEPKELDNQSFGRVDDTEIDPERQGISNRPGDEDPDSGVDRQPGEPLAANGDAELDDADEEDDDGQPGTGDNN